MKSPYRTAALLFLLASGSRAQVVTLAGGGLTPFGLQGLTVTALAAESIEKGISAGSLEIFAGTEREGIFKADPFDPAAAWKSLGLKGGIITALGVQHWGVGPRDGLTLLAAALPGISSRDTGLIYRREEGFLPDTAWSSADSGIDKSRMKRINALDAFYYTGHQPPERRIAGGESGLYAGGIMAWNDASPRADIKINDIDCAPHWPAGANAAWGAGQTGVMPAAFHSTDRGISWISIWLPAMIEGEAFSVACNPRSLDSIFIGGTNSIWITRDNGKSWSTSALGTPGVRLQALAVDPLLPGNVYAGGADFQNGFWFFHSTDGGQSWRRIFPPVNTPLNGVSSILALNSGAPSYLPKIFLSTLGTGVWIYDPSAATGVSDVLPDPAAPRIEIYPQPCGPGAPGGSGEVTFRIILPPGGEGVARVAVHDSFGRILDDLGPGISGSTTADIRWKPGPIATGVYFLRIRAGGRQLARPFLYLNR